MFLLEKIWLYYLLLTYILTSKQDFIKTLFDHWKLVVFWPHPCSLFSLDDLRLMVYLLTYAFFEWAKWSFWMSWYVLKMSKIYNKVIEKAKCHGKTVWFLTVVLLDALCFERAKWSFWTSWFVLKKSKTHNQAIEK